MKSAFTVCILLVVSIAGSTLAWEAVEFPRQETITGIQFIHPDTGYVVTAQGSCALTMDAGANWLVMDVADHPLEDVYFFNSDTGLVCGSKGGMYRTVDGGLSWKSIDPGSETAHFMDIEMFNHYNGLVVGMERGGENPYSSLLMETSDGGQTWQPLPPLGMGTFCFFRRPGQPLYCLSFGRLNMSIDGGKTWSSVKTADGPPGRDVALFGTTGIVVGPKGFCAVSHDGGIQWAPNHQGDEKYLLAVELIDDKIGYIGGVKQVLMKTIDGGVSWISETPPIDIDIAEFFRIGDFLYAVGTNGGIIREKIK